MSSFPMQPLEVYDFSGGITENILQGDTKRYAIADNLLITVDKKLKQRDGIVSFDLDNYILPSGDQRVNGMYSVLTDEKLLFQSGRQFYHVDEYTKSLTEIKGPTNNAAFGQGDEYSETTYGEFQKQIYFTNDTPSQPIKVYKNEEDTFIAKTVGLPRAFTTGNYNNSTLLGACITLANEIRTKFIAHMKDAKNTSFIYNNLPSFNFTNLHQNVDKYSLSYFETQVFTPFVDPEIPNPIPTPAPNATDEASLYTLIKALNDAYEHHMIDAYNFSLAQGSGITPYYHQMLLPIPPRGTAPLPPSGPHARLTDTAKPTSLEDAAAALDDLHQKLGWHQRGVFIHSPTNDPSQFDKYKISLPKIGKIQQAKALPTVTPDYTDLINYANNVKYLYNAHTSNNNTSGGGTGAHAQPSTFYPPYSSDIVCKLPNCTDMDSFYLMTYWLRSLYYIHYYDAANPLHTNITFTRTANSKVISAITSTGGTPVTNAGMAIFCEGGFLPTVSDPLNPYPNGSWAMIRTGGVGTCTLDRPSAFSGTLVPGQLSGSQAYAPAFYHVYRNVPTPDLQAIGVLGTYQTFSGSNPEQGIDALSTQPYQLGTDTKNWLEMLTEMFTAFANHANYQAVHLVMYSGGDIFWNTSSLQNQFFIPQVEQVVYSYVFTDKYKVEKNGIEYLVRSNPVYSEVEYVPVQYPLNYIIKSINSAWYPDYTVKTQRPTVISNLPVITNTSETNYDVSNIKLQFYRTTDGGTVYYLLDEIDNGTTTYSDYDNDSIASPGREPLNTKETIYTTGGIVGWDQPPKAKYVHILNGTAYYGAIEDTGQFFPNRILQSVQYAPDAAPASFYDDLDDDLTGISSTRSNLIAFCKSSIYRMSQGFNQIGQGALLHDRISDTLGSLNAAGIVRTEIGVFFPGNDGFYYTDGYQIIKISLELDKTYLALTESDSQKRCIYGSYDRATRRIWWSMKRNPTDSNNDVFYIFYLNYGVKPSGTFTTASNGNLMRAASVVFQNGVMYFGHENGYLFKTDADTKTDLIIDKTKAAALWETQHVPYWYRSLAVDGGTAFKRKWITKAHVFGDNNGNMSIQPNAIRDMNFDYDGIKELAPINYTDNITWGTPNYIWGDPDCVWNNKGKMDVWRRFPQTSLRSDFIQFELKPADQIVYASSVGYPFGANALANAAADTVTIITPTGFTDIRWPNDVKDMFISFAYDEYQTKFKILSRVDDQTISVEDTNGELIDITGDGVEWQISGIKKEQKLTLSGYVLHYAFLGDKTQKYPGASSNDGPGNGGGNP